MATEESEAHHCFPDETRDKKRMDKNRAHSPSICASPNSAAGASTEPNPLQDLTFLPDPSYDLRTDTYKTGPSGLGPSNFIWDHSEPGPLTLSPFTGEVRTVVQMDRSNPASVSAESSLGDSRSPDVLWKDGFSSPDEAIGSNIPTRMFSYTAKRKREDNHWNIPTRMFNCTTKRKPDDNHWNIPTRMFTHHSKRKRYSEDNHYSRHANNDSCVSDMSESSPDSANCSASSPKDGSNGSGANCHSSSGTNSDREKQEKISQANFDKVLIDANQRRHIRNKVRNAGTDSGSDSSSGNTCMNMTGVDDPLATSMKRHFATSESSDIGATYMSAQCDLTLPRSTMLTGGVTNSSTGVSTMYTSQGNKVSDGSKQESMSSGSCSNRKRHLPWSIARYYHQTKRPNLTLEAPGQGEEGLVDIEAVLGKGPGQTERKRKRFHRTFTALRQSGLLDLTMQTASLMEQNKKMQKQLGELHRQAHLMYNTVSHFSKIQPNAFNSPEAQKVMEGLKDMVNKNPVKDIDMSTFESTSRDSRAIESGQFTMSNEPTSSLRSSGSVTSAPWIPGTLHWSQDTSGPRNSNDSAIQSITTTSSSSEKSGQ